MKLENLKLLLLLGIGIWIGMLIGLSFIEAPLKFRAPGITTELGVGIGRIIFSVFNKIQIVLSIGLITIVSLRGFDHLTRSLIIGISIVVIIMLAQSLWLQPSLNARVASLLAGHPQPPSQLHLYFIITEVIKLVALIFIFINFFRNA